MTSTRWGTRQGGPLRVAGTVELITGPRGLQGPSPRCCCLCTELCLALWGTAARPFTHLPHPTPGCDVARGAR